MIKIPMGMILKQIIDEKKLKAQDVADKLGISRQSVYQSYAKLAMSEEDIARWAVALGVDKQDIYDRMESRASDSGSEYLKEFLANMETQFNELKEIFSVELSAKNRQIEKLMDLLGKLEVSEETTCKIIDFGFSELTEIRA